MTSGTTCNSCIVVVADYTTEFQAWQKVERQRRQTTSSDHLFPIPYRRVDIYPGFRSLTQSADTGCALCASIKSRLEAVIHERGSPVSLNGKPVQIVLKAFFNIDHESIANSIVISYVWEDPISSKACRAMFSFAICSNARKNS